MPLSDVVNIVISVESAQLQREGFGIPCILGLSNRFTERARTYSTLAGMVSDGFLSTDVEYKEAQRLFGQTPRPPSIVIGRRTNLPTLRWAVTPVAVNGGRYQMKVGGTLVTFQGDATVTPAEVITGLKTQIDLLALPITTSDQTTYLRIIENVPGAWHSVEVLNPNLLGIAQDHADAGIAADLDALVVEDNSWYGLVSPDASSATILAAAAWIEAAKKLYAADSQDSEVETHVLTGATDVAAAVKNGGYARTFVNYHRNNGAFFSAAWIGRVFPIDAGSEMWSYKTLAGVDVLPLTDTQAKNITDKYANHYTRVFGKNLTQKGTTGAGEYVDVTRGSDWLRYDMGGRVFLAVTAPEGMEKLPYDDNGVGVLKNAVRASLKEAQRRLFIKEVPAPTVTAPLVADVSDVDKRARNFPDLAFSAELAGAIQSVTISGVVRA